jgi:uncharacterized protein with PQ loop repeat
MLEIAPKSIPTQIATVPSSVLIVSLATKLLGEPHQIRLNWKRQSTLGISPALYVLTFISYCLWTVHRVLLGDVYLIAAQSVGILTSGIVLAQIWLYRDRGAMDSSERPSK